MNDSSERLPYVRLEDERVLLRPLEETDYENLLPFAIHERGLWKYSLVRADGEDGLRNYLDIALSEKAAGREFRLSCLTKKKMLTPAARGFMILTSRIKQYNSGTPGMEKDSREQV
jgi:hypothetical protein